MKVVRRSCKTLNLHVLQLEKSFENATTTSDSFDTSATGTEADSDHLAHHLETLNQQLEKLTTELVRLQVELCGLTM